MPNLGPTEIILLLLVLILLFGAKKLPETARGLGRSMRIFKAETKGLRDDDNETDYSDQPTAIREIPTPAPVQQPQYVQQAQQQAQPQYVQQAPQQGQPQYVQQAQPQAPTYAQQPAPTYVQPQQPAPTYVQQPAQTVGQPAPVQQPQAPQYAPPQHVEQQPYTPPVQGTADDTRS